MHFYGLGNRLALIIDEMISEITPMFEELICYFEIPQYGDTPMFKRRVLHVCKRDVYRARLQYAGCYHCGMMFTKPRNRESRRVQDGEMV